MEKENTAAVQIPFLNEKNEPKIKVYKKRWIILGIYITYATLSTAQWLQYSIITNLVVKYYNVSVNAVDWSSMVFMIMWPILVFPVSFIIDKTGLRVAALVGSITTALGAAVKVFSIDPSLYYVVMIGQTITAISQLFILCLPSKIAVTWFHPDEASKVCSLGVFGMTLGTALGFVVPPMIVKDHDDINEIAIDMNIMCWVFAIACTPVALVVFFYFPDQPELAPSLTQHYSRENKVDVDLGIFLKSLMEMLKNVPFLLLLVSCGCNFGIYCAFGTLLNQIILSYYEGAQEDAGRMGLFMILIGMIGTVGIGIILDKTRKYKESSIIVFILCAITLGGLLMALEMKIKWMCYVTISIYGIFLSAYIPLSYELAIETTYPLPESTTNGVLLASSQIFAIALTMALSEILIRFGAIYSIIAQIAVFIFGTFTTCITPNILNRQNAIKKATENTINIQPLDGNMNNDINVT